jgi:hypothetical protein
VAYHVYHIKDDTVEDGAALFFECWNLPAWRLSGAFGDAIPDIDAIPFALL